MNTLLAILMLVVFGVVASFLSVFLLNLAGLPGALMAGTPGRRSKTQFRVASVVAAVGQSYVYLSFVVFVVGWTAIAARREDTVGWLLWVVSFPVVVLPIWITLIRARVEAQELEHASAQVEALHLTMLVSIVAFYLFLFAPKLMHAGWAWVPYISD